MPRQPHIPEATDYRMLPDDTLIIRARYLAFHIEKRDSAPAVMAYFEAEMGALVDELLDRMITAA